ncbi:MAG: sterol desaturase domain protein, partial [Gammaproteobacteria bacterium]|nr:sterol desaturase domain protein [Gammaproteobacteria bacterium]
EILLSSTSLFNHSNVYSPESLDRKLRCFIVTPDMHRVHHSVIRTETDSNYGFNLPWWDRVFGTYRAQPQAGHLGMTIGLEEFRDSSAIDIMWLLVQPFMQTRRKHPEERIS